MPPAPIARRISYGPSRVPGARDMEPSAERVGEHSPEDGANRQQSSTLGAGRVLDNGEFPFPSAPCYPLSRPGEP